MTEHTDLELIDMLEAADAKFGRMTEDFRKIAHYADAVKKVLTEILPDDPEGCLVRLTVDKISEIAEANGR